MSPLSSYYELQIEGSAKSRGTPYGERVRGHAKHALIYLEGSVVDIGCNDGYAMEVFRDAGRQVRGIEINPEHVKEATERGLDVICMDMHDLADLNGSLRAENIFCSHTLEHAHDPKSVLAEFDVIAERRMYIVVPMEQEIPEENPSHFCKFPSVGAIEEALPAGWMIVMGWVLDDPERELAVLLEREK